MNYALCTFHKCASNWFRDIFWAVSEDQDISVVPFPKTESRFGKPVKRGSESLWIFATGRYEDFESAVGQGAVGQVPCILAVRDPRDALVSQYYSWKFTHKNNSPRILAAREQLQQHNERLGLEYLIKNRFFSFGNNIVNWGDKLGSYPSINILRYEDVLEDFSCSVGEALSHLGIRYERELLARLEKDTSFQTKTKRQRGEEDQQSHYRKGVAGDHRRFFDKEISALFDQEYGAALSILGYR